MAHSLQAKLFAGIRNRLRVKHLGFDAKADDPAEESGGDGYTDGEIKMIFSVGDHHKVFSELVDHHIDKAFMETQFHIGGRSLEHLECLICVLV